MKRILALMLCFVGLVGCIPGQAVDAGGPILPADMGEDDWDTADPGELGMNTSHLEALTAAAETDPLLGAIVVVKDGCLVYEYYRQDCDSDSRFRMNSCSKSVTGALVGLAIDQGEMSLDDPLADYLPQAAASETEGHSEITIRHLLTHTSGIEWHEWGANKSSWKPFICSSNWVNYVLAQPMAAIPGTVFNYNTGGVHLLSAALENAVEQSAYDYGREYIFAPMGMDSVIWHTDPQGITDGGNGIAMTPRDAAKFGQLYLDSGRWQGQQILPEGWVEASVEQQADGAGKSKYGYQWWLRPFGEEEYPTYYAMGSGGQFIFVVAELEMVVVIARTTVEDAYAPWPYFTDYILEACSEEPEQEPETWEGSDTELEAEPGPQVPEQQEPPEEEATEAGDLSAGQTGLTDIPLGGAFFDETILQDYCAVAGADATIWLCPRRQ